MRMLCAVDGSEYSQWAVQALEAFASREPESVTLLHIIDASAIATAQGKNLVSAKRALKASEKAGHILLRETERWARVALSQAVTGPRTTVQSLLAHGPVARTIVRQARRLKMNLIVMGSRGLSDIPGVLMGSISGEVLATAPCPVLIIKQPIKKVLRVALAVDHSNASRAASRFIRTCVLPESATVILCSAEPPVTKLAARHLSESQARYADPPGTRTGDRPRPWDARRLHQGRLYVRDEGSNGTCDRPSSGMSQQNRTIFWCSVCGRRPHRSAISEACRKAS